MHRILFALLMVAPLIAAQDLVPHSSSDDGTRALMSQPESTHPPRAPAKIWVVELPSKRKLSSNLVRTSDEAYSDQLLFGVISLVAHEGWRAGGGAINYEVLWSDDLRRVTVSGGAHKFWHSVTFELTGRIYRRANVP